MFLHALVKILGVFRSKSGWFKQFDNNGGLFELTGAELEIRSKVVAKLQLLNVSSEPIDTSVPYNVEFRLVNGPCGIGFPETTLLDETGIEACATNPLPAGATTNRVDGDLRIQLPESCFDDLIGAGQLEVGFEGDNGPGLFVVPCWPSRSLGLLLQLRWRCMLLVRWNLLS